MVWVIPLKIQYHAMGPFGMGHPISFRSLRDVLERAPPQVRYREEVFRSQTSRSI